MKKNGVTDLRIKHIESNIKEIKESLKEITEILQTVARQDQKIKDIDTRVQINEKRVERLQTRTMDRMWNGITIFVSAILAGIISIFIGKR